MNAKSISKEKKDLIIKLRMDGDPNATGTAGRIINEKYGKGWRERLSIEDQKINPSTDKTKMSYYDE